MKKNVNKFKLICRACLTEKSCNTNYKKVLIAKFGDEDGINTGYVCRECAKANPLCAKAKRLPKTINGMLEVLDNRVLAVPDMPVPQNRSPFTAEELATTNTCWRPDIWNENKKRFGGEPSCNGCPIGKQLGGVCGCKITKLFSGVDTDPFEDTKVYGKKRKKIRKS